MSILILSTVGATVWVNSLVNLDTERAALLAQLQTRVMDWSKTTLATDQAEMKAAIHILLNCVPPSGGG